MLVPATANRNLLLCRQAFREDAVGARQQQLIRDRDIGDDETPADAGDVPVLRYE